MKTQSILAAASIYSISASFGAIAYTEEFDGNTNDYNSNSASATVAGDWVDFGNRINSDSYTTASGGTESVLAGTSASNDPQIRSDFGFGIDKSLVESFTLRLRIDTDQNSVFDDPLSGSEFFLFWGSTSYGSPGATNIGDTNINLGIPSSLVAETNGWHIATWSIPTGGLTAGANSTIESMRIDPTNLADGNGDSFEIDYLTISTVPEPTSLSLVALGMIAACSRKRRH